MRRPATWRRLSRKDQRRIVTSLARKLRDQWPADFDRWGVVTIGFGWRIRQSRNRIVRDVLVLSLGVARKRESSRLQPERRIPRHWPVTARLRGQRCRLRVPIDVCESLRRLRAHGPSPRLDVTSDGMQPARGTACVLLLDASLHPWLLSCHHVIGNSNFDSLLDPDWSATVVAAGESRTATMTGDREFGRLQPDSYDCVDAGIGRFAGSALTTTDWAAYPVAASTQGTFLADVAGTPRICTARGEIIATRFLKLEYDFEMRYRSKARAFMREVALLEVAGGALPPVGGDSGSPIIGRGGRWLGMHIGGGRLVMHADGLATYRDVAVVLPSHVLLDRDTFGRTLTLAT